MKVLMMQEVFFQESKGTDDLLDSYSVQCTWRMPGVANDSFKKVQEVARPQVPRLHVQVGFRVGEYLLHASVMALRASFLLTHAYAL